MSNDTPIKLRLPRQDLPDFARFPLSRAGAETWARSLPAANTRRAVAQLREAVGELNRHPLSATLRFEVMEALYPTLEVCLHNLSRRYLNQPLILPEEPRQFSELAESLCSLFSTGYTVVAVHAIQQRGELQGANPARLACEALQRALYFAGRGILQTYQLQQQVERQRWLTLHQLYALGERQQLEALPLKDLQGRPTTLQTSYLQHLLLGCIKANQLRQSDLGSIYPCLPDWARHARLLKAPAEGVLFALDLHGDHPPDYHGAATASGPQYRYLDTREVVRQLKTLRQGERSGDQHAVRMADGTLLAPNTLDHVIAALGTQTQRNFGRRRHADGTLEIGIGLSSVHYHAAGERPFASLLPAHVAALAGGENPFSSRSVGRDQWEMATPDDIHRGEADDDSHTDAGDDHIVEVDPVTAARIGDAPQAAGIADTRFSIFSARTINASPGGYCLEWSQHAPPNLRSGELLCIRESGQEEWLIATVRWISSLEQAHTLVGVELLSPRGMPYGARVVGPRGRLSQPMRVLLLPEIKLVGKPHTLVTPQTRFRERQKVVLLRDGEEFLVQLQQQIAATATFSQFDFRYIKPLEQRTSAAAEEIELPRPAFDSLWADI